MLVLWVTSVARSVALLMEGVDRNKGRERSAAPRPSSPSSWRAWIEIAYDDGYTAGRASPSSWRAWIEIRPVTRYNEYEQSPSSWRAWIEIETDE